MTSDKAVINNKLCLKSMSDSLQIFRPIPCLCNKVDDLKRVRKRSLHFSGLRKRRGLCKEDFKKAALCFLIELSVWNRLAKFQSMQLLHYSALNYSILQNDFIFNKNSIFEVL